jgi:hypothetical protein
MGDRNRSMRKGGMRKAKRREKEDYLKKEKIEIKLGKKEKKREYEMKTGRNERKRRRIIWRG